MFVFFPVASKFLEDLQFTGLRKEEGFGAHHRGGWEVVSRAMHVDGEKLSHSIEECFEK